MGCREAVVSQARDLGADLVPAVAERCCPARTWLVSVRRRRVEQEIRPVWEPRCDGSRLVHVGAGIVALVAEVLQDHPIKAAELACRVERRLRQLVAVACRDEVVEAVEAVARAFRVHDSTSRHERYVRVHDQSLARVTRPCCDDCCVSGNRSRDHTATTSGVTCAVGYAVAAPCKADAATGCGCRRSSGNNSRGYGSTGSTGASMASVASVPAGSRS